MNATNFTFLLSKPNTVGSKNSASLEKVVAKFPYFQSARALHLKMLYNQESYFYNDALKKTAAHSTDRSVLFNFISSPVFLAFENKLQNEKLRSVNEIVVNFSEVSYIENIPQEKTKIELSILSSIEEAKPDEKLLLEDKLELKRPLEFSPSEKHSFQEWLQLSNFLPIERTAEKQKDIDKNLVLDKKAKNQLIDTFIDTNPKIPTINKDSVFTPVFQEKTSNNNMLMTETLARVYLEQKKYQKAIQAYEILILKYPEKSSFFADRISDINNFQQNNK